jgi:hypothetical protein
MRRRRGMIVGYGRTSTMDQAGARSSRALSLRSAPQVLEDTIMEWHQRR